jgi:hypothetical protein
MRGKSLVLIILFLVQSFCVFAQRTALDKNKKNSSLIQDRSFEIGLALLNVNFANNFLSATDILKDVIIIDLDKLGDGFKFNLGISAAPIYFRFTTEEGWGLGLSTDINAIGVLNISGNMLSFSEAIKDNSDVGGAVFSSVALNSFFDAEGFKIKISPSLFYTLAYIAPPKNMPSSVVYTLDYSDGTLICINYAARLYTGYLFEDNKFSLTSNPGLDFTVGFEYPLAKGIGLADAAPFLDFDVGLDLINIPFIQSTMTNYKKVKGQVGRDEPIKIVNKDDDDEDKGLLSTDEIVDEKKIIQVNRPFKMIARADWRPFGGNKFFTLTPVIGFCYNDLYYKPFSLESGLNVCLNFGNLFLIKTGFNYTDRLFVNNLGFILNFRAFELDIGLDLRSQEIAQIWRGAGLGVNFGLKFGW